MSILRFAIGQSPTGLSPLKCQGFDMASAGLGLFESLLTNQANYMIQDEANYNNYRIAMENNKQAIKLAEQNWDFQEKMNTVNNQFAHDEALAAWNRQKQFYDPTNQVKMLQEAGLNPSVYYGGFFPFH